MFMRFVFYNTCTILIRIHGLIDFRLFSSSPIIFSMAYTFNYFWIPKEQTTVTVKNRVYIIVFIQYVFGAILINRVSAWLFIILIPQNLKCVFSNFFILATHSIVIISIDVYKKACTPNNNSFYYLMYG